jgi:glyoxylase-like metal-dependent hydrolase (beta-lactamase superfamily II)
MKRDRSHRSAGAAAGRSILLTLLPLIVLATGAALRSPVAAQAPTGRGAATPLGLKQLKPGHYVYSTTSAGRIFSSGVIVTSEGAVVVDALESETIARAERDSIASVLKQPVRYLVSSSFHDPYSKGNIAYADVFKIGHDSYRAGLLDQMERGALPADERRARLPTLTFRDRVSVRVGGKEIQILHLGRAHTPGDSIVFVPEDRIAYLSEVFFAEEFPRRSRPISSCRATVPFRMTPRARGRSCTACGRFSSTRGTPSRPRLREGPPKIRRLRR